MDSQNNQQSNQQNNQQNNQREQNTNANQPQQPGLSGLFFPINFIFREGAGHDNPQQNGSQEQAQREQIPQFIHFFTFPMPGAQGVNANQGLFFFTPFNIPQQEIRKPRASESAMKNLPIVTITKEHVKKQMSCPICLEPFTLFTEQEKNETEVDQHGSVRQMPCEHMFCESCLFQWLRQNNSCPLCRKEIKAEEAEAQEQSQEANNEARPQVPNFPLFGVINIAAPPSPSLSSSNENSNSQPHHTSHSTRRPTVSCALASVGCCEEIDNDTSTTIITLPQCHHRFHASCLRTSLLVEGYSSGDFNSNSHPLNFRCPTCRAPAIIQSDMLKITHDEQQHDHQDIPFNLPLTIYMPDSDDMDVD